MSDLKQNLRVLDQLELPDFRSRTVRPHGQECPERPRPRWGRLISGAVACVLVVSLFVWGIVSLHGALGPESPPSGGRYVDRLGWSIRVPGGWRTTTIKTDDAMVSYSGASFSNTPLASPSANTATPDPAFPDVARLPHTAVVLTITHREGGPAPDNTRDDSRLPLSPDDLRVIHEQLPGGSRMRSTSFVNDALDFQVVLLSGDKATPSDLAAARAMIASIHFQPTHLGSLTAQGSVVAMDASALPVGAGRYLAPPESNAYMLIHAPEGRYAFLLPQTSRARFRWFKADRQIFELLPGDRDPVAAWDRFGRVIGPHGGPNAPRALSDLYAVTLSWDDHLLLHLDATYDSGLAFNAWH
jgi:hypothetical protein